MVHRPPPFSVAPPEVDRMDSSDDQFGQIALRNGFLQEDQLAEALRIQREKKPGRLIGELLVEGQVMSQGESEAVLRVQRQLRRRASASEDPLEAANAQAQALLKARWASREEVVDALKEIKTRIKGGKAAPQVAWLLTKRGILTREQLAAVTYPNGGKPQVDGYKIISEIRAGGVGTVFRARQLSIDRIVAIKILAPKLTGNEELVARFLEEGRAQARLNHQNTVNAIDLGESDGMHWFVMEYVNGESVLELLQRSGPLKLERALGITYEMARAIEHAHSHRIIHRDIKPSNILINHRNVAKLCDLGFAQIDGKESVPRVAGTTLGTPHYMSPEQARGALDLDERSDVYSLGASLYQMLTGRLPFPGRSPKEIMRRHIVDDLEFKPSEEDRFGAACGILRQMMAKDRDDRLQSGSEVMEALAPFLDHRLTGTDFNAPKTGRWSKVSAKKKPKPKGCAAVVHEPLGPHGQPQLEALIEGLEAGGLEVKSMLYEEATFSALEGADAVIFGEAPEGPGDGLKQLLEEHGGVLISKAGGAWVVGRRAEDDVKLLLSKVFNALLAQGMLVQGGLRRQLETADDEAYHDTLRRLGRQIATACPDRSAQRS